MKTDELVNLMIHRLDKIEEKLDKHLEQVSINKADITWLRGHVNVQLSFILSLAGAVIFSMVKLFKD